MPEVYEVCLQGHPDRRVLRRAIEMLELLGSRADDPVDG